MCNIGWYSCSTINWIEKIKLKKLKTILTFDNYESEPFEVTNGLDQGPPSSTIDE
jgi:hypothetical protein